MTEGLTVTIPAPTVRSVLGQYTKSLYAPDRCVLKKIGE